MINRFLDTYGFDGIKGFLLSLFPSFKYGVAGQTISASAVLGFISSLLGMSRSEEHTSELQSRI